MKKGILFIVGISSMLISSGQNLKNTLKVGDKFSVVSDMETKLNLSSPMGEIEIASNKKDYTTVEVKKLTDTSINAGITTTRMIVKSSAMGRETNFDSETDKKSDNPMLSELIAKIGKEVAVDADAKGVIKPAIVASDDDDENPMKMFQSFTQMIPTRDWMEIVTPAAVDNEMKVGNTWKHEYIKKSDDLSNIFATTYTISNIDNDVATITFEGNVVTNGKMSMMGQTAKMSGISKETGTVKLNIITGITTESSLKLNLDVKAKVDGESLPITGTLVKTVQIN